MHVLLGIHILCDFTLVWDNPTKISILMGLLSRNLRFLFGLCKARLEFYKLTFQTALNHTRFFTYAWDFVLNLTIAKFAHYLFINYQKCWPERVSLQAYVECSTH